METRNALEGANKLVKGTQEGFAKAAEYAEAARELHEAGKELSDVQSALLGMTKLGKISGGLMVISIGLELALKVFGGPTTEEQTLTEIKKVSDQITGLSSHIDDQFSALYKKDKYTAAQEEVSPTWNSIESLRLLIDKYATAKAEEAKAAQASGDPHALAAARSTLASLAKSLRKIGEWQCEAYAHTLLSHCKPEPGDIDIDLFDTMKADTKGDMSVLARRAMAYMGAVMTCALGASIIVGLNDAEDSKKGILLSERKETLGHSFSAILDELGQLTGQWLDKCRDDIGTDLVDFLKVKSPDIAIDTTNPKNTAKELGEVLKAHWYCYDFTVVVYAGSAVRGFDHHGYGGNNTCGIFQNAVQESDGGPAPGNVSFPNGDVANIVIHWDHPLSDMPGRTVSEEQRVVNEPDLGWGLAGRTLPVGPRGALLTVMSKTPSPTVMANDILDIWFSTFSRATDFLSLIRVNTFTPAEPEVVTPFGSGNHSKRDALLVPTGTKMGVWASNPSRVLTLAISRDSRASGQPDTDFNAFEPTVNNEWAWVTTTAGDPAQSTHAVMQANLDARNTEKVAAEQARIEA